METLIIILVLVLLIVVALIFLFRAKRPPADQKALEDTVVRILSGLIGPAESEKEREPIETSPREIRQLEDALVDYFAQLRTSRVALRVLAMGEGSPESFDAVAQAIKHEFKRRRSDPVPSAAIRMTLMMLVSAGLANNTPDGFTITETGLALQEKITHRRGQV
jgi:hypothetical protein